MKMISFQSITALCNNLGQRAVAQMPALEKGLNPRFKRSNVVVPDGLVVGIAKGKGGALRTTRAIKSGATVFAFQGRLRRMEEATPLGLQIARYLFLEADSNDPNRFDEYTNHSCDPNGFVYFGSGRPEFVACRDIEAGEELTFNYNTTEWDMFEQEKVMKAPCVFACCCNSDRCIGRVMGFRYLSIEEKIALHPFLSPYLRNKFEAELTSLNVRMLTK